MAPFTPELIQKLKAHCGYEAALAGGSKTICQAGIKLVSEHHQVPAIKAMQICLEEGYWPLRFVRNAGVFSAAGQSALLAAHVFIAGCGGLGGHVATLLARAGVGTFTLCDGDVFSESNLNRQSICREDNLGQNKAQAAAQELKAIASHVELKVLPVMLEPGNAEKALAGAHLAVDCLDSLPARKLLAQAAARQDIPLVHGAIAGHEGFVSLVNPGEDTLRVLYGDAPPQSRDCAEYSLGVPTTTPAATAALQAALALHKLSGKISGTKTLYHLDLLAPLLEEFNF